MRIVTAILVIANSLLSANGILGGFVKDAKSGEVIAFANIYLKDENIGTLSDRNGYYVMSSVPEGEHTIIFCIIGYRQLEKRIFIHTGKLTRFNAKLESEPVLMKTVIVTAEKERFKKEVDAGVHQLKTTDLKMVPGFIEPDLFKSMQMLPGVVAISDFSSALYVRGGSPDQNLFLLDGANVYNPYHLGGLYSTFNLDALKSAELHAGSFPAEYGNAVSSVLDVEMKQGNSERFEGKWDISLLSSKLVLEGPLPKGSFLLAGRRTYLDAITYAISKISGNKDIYFPYYFYDLQSKVNLDLSDKNRLTLSGFFGDDVVYFNNSSETLDFRWGNYTLGLKWRYLITPKVFTTLLLTKSRYRVALFDKYQVSGNEFVKSRLKLGIGDISLKEDINYFLNSNHTVKAGLEGRFLDIYNLQSQDTTIYLDAHQKPEYLAMYLLDKWQASSPLLLNLGLRGEYFTGGNYYRISPRLSAKYLLKEDLAIKAGYGYYYQFLSIPFPRDEMTMKFPVFMFQQWKPADDKFMPVNAVHYSLGFEKWLASDMDLSMDGYYKSIANLIETEMPFNWLGSEPSAIESIVYRVGTGWASGIELLLKRKNSWVGYSFAITKRRFDGISFYPIFDARHSFNIVWSVPLGRNWILNLQWLYRSGFPYTGPIGRYQFVDIIDVEQSEQEYYDWILVNGRRGGFRYPSYHRLDVGLEKNFKLFGLKCVWYFQIVNLYARKNVLWYNYNTYEDPPKREPYYMLPFPIPSLGIRGEF